MRSNLILAALVALALSSPAFAQERNEAADVAELERLLLSRDREAMRLGEDPLVVVGIEQEDNDFRAATPGLQRTNATTSEVDLEELHARKLAMFTTGETFHVAPGAVRSFRSRQDPRFDPPPVRRTAPAAATEEPEQSTWGWALPITLLAVLIGFIVHRSGFHRA